MHALQGKVALITGGSSGIGRATALHLAGLGARVAVAARSKEALDQVVHEAEQQGGKALAVPTDVTDHTQCRQAVSATVDQFGRLDILICSAGISMRAPFAEADLEVMERVVRVNFLGTMSATWFALPHIKQTHGSLVAISSLTGKCGTPQYATYGASKFAVQGLYEALRRELAPDGVHVGIVSPGFVDTPLREHVLGPNGQPWTQPPSSPFRVWPVAECVKRIVELIVRRRAETLLPAFVRPLLALDQLCAGRLSDAYLGRKFNQHGSTRPYY